MATDPLRPRTNSLNYDPNAFSARDPLREAQTAVRTGENARQGAAVIRAVASDQDQVMREREAAAQEAERQRKAQEVEAEKQQREAERAAEAERARSVREAAAQGVETTTDVETGKRDIARRDDGTPKYKIGEVGAPSQKEGKWVQSYRNEAGQVQERDVPTTTDPKTGEKYFHRKDEFGAPVREVVGTDPDIQRKLQAKAQHDAEMPKLQLQDQVNTQRKADHALRYTPVNDELQSLKRSLVEHRKSLTQVAKFEPTNLIDRSQPFTRTPDGQRAWNTDTGPIPVEDPEGKIEQWATENERLHAARKAAEQKANPLIEEGKAIDAEIKRNTIRKAQLQQQLLRAEHPDLPDSITAGTADETTTPDVAAHNQQTGADILTGTPDTIEQAKRDATADPAQPRHDIHEAASVAEQAYPVTALTKATIATIPDTDPGKPAYAAILTKHDTGIGGKLAAEKAELDKWSEQISPHVAELSEPGGARDTLGILGIDPSNITPQELQSRYQANPDFWTPERRRQAENAMQRVVTASKVIGSRAGEMSKRAEAYNQQSQKARLDLQAELTAAGDKAVADSITPRRPDSMDPNATGSGIAEKIRNLPDGSVTSTKTGYAINVGGMTAATVDPDRTGRPVVVIRDSRFARDIVNPEAKDGTPIFLRDSNNRIDDKAYVQMYRDAAALVPTASRPLASVTKDENGKKVDIPLDEIPMVNSSPEFSAQVAANKATRAARDKLADIGMDWQSIANRVQKGELSVQQGNLLSEKLYGKPVGGAYPDPSQYGTREHFEKWVQESAATKELAKSLNVSPDKLTEKQKLEAKANAKPLESKSSADWDALRNEYATEMASLHVGDPLMSPAAISEMRGRLYRETANYGSAVKSFAKLSTDALGSTVGMPYGMVVNWGDYTPVTIGATIAAKLAGQETIGERFYGKEEIATRRKIQLEQTDSATTNLARNTGNIFHEKYDHGKQEAEQVLNALDSRQTWDVSPELEEQVKTGLAQAAKTAVAAKRGFGQPGTEADYNIWTNPEARELLNHYIATGDKSSRAQMLEWLVKDPQQREQDKKMQAWVGTPEEGASVWAQVQNSFRASQVADLYQAGSEVIFDATAFVGVGTSLKAAEVAGKMGGSAAKAAIRTRSMVNRIKEGIDAVRKSTYLTVKPGMSVLKSDAIKIANTAQGLGRGLLKGSFVEGAEEITTTPTQYDPDWSDMVNNFAGGFVCGIALSGLSAVVHMPIQAIGQVRYQNASMAERDARATAYADWYNEKIARNDPTQTITPEIAKIAQTFYTPAHTAWNTNLANAQVEVLRATMELAAADQQAAKSPVPTKEAARLTRMADRLETVELPKAQAAGNAKAVANLESQIKAIRNRTGINGRDMEGGEETGAANAQASAIQRMIQASSKAGEIQQRIAAHAELSVQAAKELEALPADQRAAWASVARVASGLPINERENAALAAIAKDGKMPVVVARTEVAPGVFEESWQVTPEARADAAELSEPLGRLLANSESILVEEARAKAEAARASMAAQASSAQGTGTAPAAVDPVKATVAAMKAGPEAFKQHVEQTWSTIIPGAKSLGISVVADPVLISKQGNHASSRAAATIINNPDGTITIAVDTKTLMDSAARMENPKDSHSLIHTIIFEEAKHAAAEIALREIYKEQTGSSHNEDIRKYWGWRSQYMSDLAEQLKTENPESVKISSEAYAAPSKVDPKKYSDDQMVMEMLRQFTNPEQETTEEVYARAKWSDEALKIIGKTIKALRQMLGKSPPPVMQDILTRAERKFAQITSNQQTAATPQSEAAANQSPGESAGPNTNQEKGAQNDNGKESIPDEGQEQAGPEKGRQMRPEVLTDTPEPAGEQSPAGQEDDPDRPLTEEELQRIESRGGVSFLDQNDEVSNDTTSTRSRADSLIQLFQEAMPIEGSKIIRDDTVDGVLVTQPVARGKKNAKIEVSDILVGPNATPAQIAGAYSRVYLVRHLDQDVPLADAMKYIRMVEQTIGRKMVDNMQSPSELGMAWGKIAEAWYANNSSRSNYAPLDLETEPGEMGKALAAMESTGAMPDGFINLLDSTTGLDDAHTRAAFDTEDRKNLSTQINRELGDPIHVAAAKILRSMKARLPEPNQPGWSDEFKSLHESLKGKAHDDIRRDIFTSNKPIATKAQIDALTERLSEIGFDTDGGSISSVIGSIYDSIFNKPVYSKTLGMEAGMAPENPFSKAGPEKSGPLAYVDRMRLTDFGYDSAKDDADANGTNIRQYADNQIATGPVEDDAVAELMSKNADLSGVRSYVGTVPIARIESDQMHVHKPTVKQHIQNFDSMRDRNGENNPVEIVKDGDNLYLRDGNHRVNAAKALGHKTINARIYVVPENPGTKFERDTDAEYLSAVEAGDIAKAQKMVDEAARSAGYTIGPVYHGTKGNFTQFDPNAPSRIYDEPGFWFTTGEKYANEFSTWAEPAGPGGRVIKAYLKADNMLTLTPDEVNLNRIQDLDNRAQAIKDRGYDGIFVPGDYDYAEGAEEWEVDQYIMFNPEQIKSADPVTRDDSGNVIPLSERFKPSSPDIRYAKKKPTSNSAAGALTALFRRTSLVTTGTARQMLGDIPGYLSAVVDFMSTQRQKAINGTFRRRDIAKAYLLTLGSIGASSQNVATFETKTGMKVPDAFITVEKGKRKIRPEEAVALWFGTPKGQSALQAIDQGIEPDLDDLNDLLRIRDAYGRNDIRNNAMRVGGKKNTLRNIVQIADAVNAAKGDIAKIEASLKSLTGIGPGKLGFIKHLLGFGDSATIDAVEINFWLTGRGNIRNLKNKRADLVRQIKASGGSALNAEVAERIEGQIQRLAASYGINGDFAAHVVHHWLWDMAKKVQTTHQGMMHSMINFAMLKPGFYSKLEQSIIEKMPETAPAQQAMNIALQNARPEEIKWSGVMLEIERLAKENKGKVPKAELLEFLRNEGSVKFEEVTLGTQTRNHDFGERVNRLQDRYEAGEQLTPEEERELFSPQQYNGDHVPTKFGQYVLPGGENYREVVLAIPLKYVPPSTYSVSPARNRYGFAVYDQTGRQISGGALTEREAQSLAYQWTKDTRPLPDPDQPKYTSSHFPDVQNYVAHMRVNEREDADGKPGLFIEEIQSDRHQEGRKKGYQGESNYNPDGSVRFTTAEFAKIPDAPFRTTWHLQMFKRALRDAVAGGKKWIGWTTGETQNDRYDLGKQIDTLNYSGSVEDGWTVQLIKDGEQINEMEIADDKLVDTVGKDVADRMRRNVGGEGLPSGMGTLEGLDLKVGGEGMKGFYDSILPKEIGKYVKQWGAKVERGEVPGTTVRTQNATNLETHDFDEDFGPITGSINVTPDGKVVATPIWRIEITPEMRESVAKGQPLFSVSKKPTSSMSVDAVNDVLRSRNLHDTPRVRVLENAGLTPQGSEWSARVLPSGTMEYNAANLSSPEEINRFIDHELSHLSLRDKAVAGSFDKFWNALNAEQQARVKEWAGNPAYQEHERQDEIMAETLRELKASTDAWTRWQTLRNNLGAWFRRMFGKAPTANDLAVLARNLIAREQNAAANNIQVEVSDDGTRYAKKKKNDDNSEFRFDTVDTDFTHDELPRNVAGIKKSVLEKLKLYAFNGTKPDLNAQISGLLQSVANSINSVADLTFGSGAHIGTILKLNGKISKKRVNEFSPLRSNVAKQISSNPEEVLEEVDSLYRELHDVRADAKETFSEKMKGNPLFKNLSLEQRQKKIKDLLFRFESRYVQRWFNTTFVRDVMEEGFDIDAAGDMHGDKAKVPVRRTARSAAWAIVAQEYTGGMSSVELSIIPYAPQVQSLDLGIDEKIPLELHHGKRWSMNHIMTQFKEPTLERSSENGNGLSESSRSKFMEIAKSLSGVTVTTGDAWKQIIPVSEEAKRLGESILILVDPPYWKGNLEGGKSNYDAEIAADADLEKLIDKVSILKEASDNGAKILFTNDWHPKLAKTLRDAGFYVIHATRDNGKKDEVVAFNFNPKTGAHETRPATHQPRGHKMANPGTDSFVLRGQGNIPDAKGNRDGGKPRRDRRGNSPAAGTGTQNLAGGSPAQQSGTGVPSGRDGGTGGNDGGRITPPEGMFPDGYDPENPDHQAIAKAVYGNMNPTQQGILRELLKPGGTITGAAKATGKTDEMVGAVLANFRSQIVSTMKAAENGGVNPATTPNQDPNGPDQYTKEGRPDLALSTLKVMQDVDATRNDEKLPTKRTWQVVQQEADKILEDYDKAYDNILAIAKMDRPMTDTETVVAKTIIARESQTGALNDPKRAIKLLMLGHSYRNTGSAAARSMNIRKDPEFSPAQRAAFWISDGILTPDQATRDAIDKADSQEKKEKLMLDWVERLKGLKDGLKERGIDIDRMLAEHNKIEQAISRAAKSDPLGAQAAKAALLPLNEAERAVVRSWQYSGMQAIESKSQFDAQKAMDSATKNSNLSRDEVARTLRKYRELMDKIAIKAMREATDATLAQDGPEPAYAKAGDRIGMLLEKMGHFDVDEYFTEEGYLRPEKARRKNTKRNGKKKASPAPGPELKVNGQQSGPAIDPKTGKPFPIGWTNGNELPGGTGAGGFSGDFGKPESGNELPGGTQEGPLEFDSMGNPRSLLPSHEGDELQGGEYDLNNPDVMRKVVHAMYVSRATTFDAWLEFWKASVLSGLKTAVVNFTSTAANGLYHTFGQRFAEGLVNSGMSMFGQGDTKAASISEFKAMARHFMPALIKGWRNSIKAWQTQDRVFEAQSMARAYEIGFDNQKFGVYGHALDGKLGDIMRNISFRHMTASDELLKGFFGHLEAAANAHRIAAKEEGLKGEAYEKRFAELMEYGSVAWVRAIDAARTISFQTPFNGEEGDPLGEDFERMLERHRNQSAKGHDLLDMLLDPTVHSVIHLRGKIKGIHFVIPFIPTMANLFKQGLRIAPTGSAVAIIDMARALKVLNTKHKGGQRTNPEIQKELASKIYNRARFLRDLSTQTLAIATYLALTGDDPPDELPTMTGTTPAEGYTSGARDLARRVMPPMTIRIGNHMIDYSRMDPISTVLAMMADYHAMTRRGEIPNDEKTGRMLGYLASMTKDKTFFQGIGNLLNAMDEGKRNTSASTGVIKFASSIASGFIPNLLRQPLREIDPYVRENSKLPGDMGALDKLAVMIRRAIDPTDAPVKLDLWGREIMKEGTGGPVIGPNADKVLRAVNPMAITTVDESKILPIDKFMLAYQNHREDGTESLAFEAPERSLEYKINGKTVRVGISDEDYQNFVSKVGQSALRSLDGTNRDKWKFNAADERQTANKAKQIRDTYMRIRENYRSMLKGKYQKQALEKARK